MEYYTLYVIFFPVLFLICYLHKNVHIHKIPFFLILFFGLIRYDTTTDYSAYVVAFWDIKKGVYDGWFEPGFVAFNKLFTFSIWGFVPLLMVSLFIPYAQIYKILKREKILVIGSFVFLTFGYFIRFENIVRQGISMGIFYYSLNYAINKKITKYSICVLISFLFHTSSIVLIPYYFLIRFFIDRKINTFFYGALILISYTLYINDVFKLILISLISKIPILQTLISDAILLNAIDYEKTLGFTLLFKLFIAWLPSFVLRNDIKNTFVNLSINISTISALISIFLIDIIILERVIEYLYIFQLIAISVMINKLLSERKFILIPVVSIFLLMIVHSRNVNSYYKNYNYQSIFSKNFKNNIFYKRYHRWELVDFDNDDNVYRGTNVLINY